MKLVKPSFSYFRKDGLETVLEYRWIGAVHEVIPPSGGTIYSDIAICHKK